MTLFEYIKSQLPNPNPAIMYNLGASDELVAYIKETPWNTNLNMLNSIGSGGGEEPYAKATFVFEEGKNTSIIKLSVDSQSDVFDPESNTITGTREDWLSVVNDYDNYRVLFKAQGTEEIEEDVPFDTESNWWLIELLDGDVSAYIHLEDDGSGNDLVALELFGWQGCLNSGEILVYAK